MNCVARALLANMYICTLAMSENWDLSSYYPCWNVYSVQIVCTYRSHIPAVVSCHVPSMRNCDVSATGPKNATQYNSVAYHLCYQSAWCQFWFVFLNLATTGQTGKMQLLNYIFRPGDCYMIICVCERFIFTCTKKKVSWEEKTILKLRKLYGIISFSPSTSKVHCIGNSIAAWDVYYNKGTR